MPNIKGRNVKIEIARTYGTSIPVTAVSKAPTAVATATAHAQLANACGYFTGVAGMAQLEGQAVRVKNPIANTFELQGLNTTTYSDYTSGNFVPVTAWDTLAEATSYTLGGGGGEKLDATTLIDTIKVEEQGLLAAATAAININSQDVPTAAMQLLIAAVQTQGFVLVRITLGNGAVRVFRGEPSLPGEDVQKGQLGTGSLDLAVKGQIMFLAP
jgi:hypothetical protein